MASDRRFGLPHPLDVQTSEDSSPRRKPGLWQSLKRALGTSATEPPRPERPAGRERSDLPLPGATSRPAPIPPPVEPKGTPGPTAMPAPRGADAPIVEDVPFLADPAAPEASPDAPAPAAGAEEEIVSEAALTADSPELAPARLARGLASFSRDNAEREKKFAHLLRDARPAPKKRPPGSRNRG